MRQQVRWLATAWFVCLAFCDPGHLEKCEIQNAYGADTRVTRRWRSRLDGSERAHTVGVGKLHTLHVAWHSFVLTVRVRLSAK